MTEHYPGATWMPAHPSNFRKASRASIHRIIIHCTDGQPLAIRTAERWQERLPSPSSAHFAIGQAGEVIQAVSLADVAFHAHRANGMSVGIEHCARTPGELSPRDPGLAPTAAQYAASAALVAWLCGVYGLPLDRHTIQGHAEIDPATTHRRCPDGCGWDWSRYMGLVAPNIA